MTNDSYKVIRILLVPKIVNLIMDEYGWSELKACSAFYNSRLNETLEDPDNDIWQLSEYKLLELFNKEIVH